MTRLRVVVTAADIAAAGPPDGADGRHCPVARAVRRRGFPDAHVGRWFWYPQGLNGLEVPLTERVATWINEYDDNQPVGPVTFYLEGPNR